MVWGAGGREDQELIGVRAGTFENMMKNMTFLSKTITEVDVSLRAVADNTWGSRIQLKNPTSNSRGKKAMAAWFNFSALPLGSLPRSPGKPHSTGYVRQGCEYVFMSVSSIKLGALLQSILFLFAFCSTQGLAARPAQCCCQKKINRCVAFLTTTITHHYRFLHLQASAAGGF